MSHVVNKIPTISLFISLGNWCNSCEEAGTSLVLELAALPIALPSPVRTTWVCLYRSECQLQMTGQTKMLKSKVKHVSVGRSLSRGKPGSVF